jgi:hypothetical protein
MSPFRKSRHDNAAIWQAIRDLREQQMSTQADADALVVQVNQIVTDLTAAQASLQAEIDKLANANPTLDLSALQAAVAPLDTQVQILGTLQPAAPVPAPAPAPVAAEEAPVVAEVAPVDPPVLNQGVIGG